MTDSMRGVAWNGGPMVRGRESRERYMLELIGSEGQLSVAEVAKQLGVSEVTVRSSLKSLEKQGLLKRTWGGAQSTDFQKEDGLLELRKLRIAEAAARLVGDGDRIMLDSGSTSSFIVPHLGDKSGVELVTNSVRAFQLGSRIPDLRVVLTGGLLDRENKAFVGAVAWKGVRNFRAKLAFVGSQGFNTSQGLVTEFGGGAEVVAAMSECSEETWLLADSSKYAKNASLSVLGLESLAGIITDKDIPPAALAALRKVVPTVITV